MHFENELFKLNFYSIQNSLIEYYVTDINPNHYNNLAIIIDW